MPVYDAPSREKTDEFELPSNPEFKVQMRRDPSYGDRAQAVAEAFRIVPDRTEQPGAWFSALMVAEAVQLIASWNLEAAEGEPLPVTYETVAGLKPVDGEKLANEAHERMEGRPAKAEAPFANGSSKSSTVTRSTRRRSSKT